MNSPAAVRDLAELRDRLRAFAEERDWDQFHSPKNLAMALIAEAAELVEHFQWLTETESGSPVCLALDERQLPYQRLDRCLVTLQKIDVHPVRLEFGSHFDLIDLPRCHDADRGEGLQDLSVGIRGAGGLHDQAIAGAKLL